MNPQSSSSEQTQQFVGPPRHLVCLLVSCFWGYDRDSAFSDQKKFAESVSEYIEKKFGHYLYPPGILGYYNDFIPKKLKEARLPDKWDETTLAISIAFLVKDSKEYDELTEVSLKDMNGKLSRTAILEMSRVISEIEKDERKDTVRKAWEKYAKILKDGKPIPTIAESDPQAKMAERLGGLTLPLMTASGQPRTQSGSTSGPSNAPTTLEFLSMESTMFLQSQAP